MTREYLRSLVVMFHDCCNRWPNECIGQNCGGHIGRITEKGFEELSVDEYNFVKQKLGVPLNTHYYEVTHYGKRYNRRGEVVSEGITSASKLFEFVRKRERRTYVNTTDILIEKFGCEEIYSYYCCYCDGCDDREDDDED